MGFEIREEDGHIRKLTPLEAVEMAERTTEMLENDEYMMEGFERAVERGGREGAIGFMETSYQEHIEQKTLR